MVADDEVTGRDPGIIGSASSAGAAHQVGHRLERAVLSPIGRAVMPTDGRRRSIRIRTVATINMTRIPPFLKEERKSHEQQVALESSSCVLVVLLSVTAS